MGIIVDLLVFRPALARNGEGSWRLIRCHARGIIEFQKFQRPVEIPGFSRTAHKEPVQFSDNEESVFEA
jgi:hypothetical protein